MRISSVVAVVVVAGAGLGLGGAVAFDGRSPTEPTPVEALRSGTLALQAGEKDKALLSLQYAAEKGYAAAQWKLGRMYASGEGVVQDDLKAFRYFSRIANLHAEDSPFTPQARYVANAFVALGRYYLSGITGTDIQPDPIRAHEMFRYAASYFADPEAQYSLGSLYLDGVGTPKDPLQAARWFRLAAKKGEHRAQAQLGGMLFDGVLIARQAALGLMWLTLARDAAGPDEAWITEMYNNAVKRATDDERAVALNYLESWLSSGRE